MYDIGVTLYESPDEIAHTDKADDNQKIEKVFVREYRDELRDGIIWVNRRQQLAFVYPSDVGLVACQLHPNGIYCVCGQYVDVGHNQSCALTDNKRVCGKITDLFFGQLPDERQ